MNGSMDQLVQAASEVSEDLAAFVERRRATGKMDDTKWGVVKRLVASKSSTRDIATAIGLSKRTARRYRALAEQDEHPTFKKRGRTRVENIILQDSVRSLLEANNCLTLQNVQAALPIPIQRSPSTICRVIRSIDFTRKRVKPIVVARNEERVIESRHAYSRSTWFIPDDKLIFVDESGFNLHLAPHYGYAPRGSAPHVVVPTQRGTNLSLLMAVSIQGVVCWDFQSSAYNAALFTQWCRLTLFPEIRGLDMVVVMDNDRFHHSPIVIAAFAEEGIRLEFLPPYSPQLNPIENVFGVLKTRYRSLRVLPRTHEEQVVAVKTIILHMRAQHLTAFFSEMRLWLERSAQRQPFL